MAVAALARRLGAAWQAEAGARVPRPGEQARGESVHSSRSQPVPVGGAPAAAWAMAFREPAFDESGAGLAPQEEAGEGFRLLEAARQRLPELPVWPLPVDLRLPEALPRNTRSPKPAQPRRQTPTQVSNSYSRPVLCAYNIKRKAHHLRFVTRTVKIA